MPRPRPPSTPTILTLAVACLALFVHFESRLIYVEPVIAPMRAEGVVKNGEKAVMLITGCGGGIGADLVKYFAESFGESVVIFAGMRALTQESSSSKRENASSCVVPVQLDVTREGDVREAVSFIKDYMKQHGITRFAGVVNNAGVLFPGRSNEPISNVTSSQPSKYTSSGPFA